MAITRSCIGIYTWETVPLLTSDREKKNSFSPTTQIVAATKGSLGIYILFIYPLRYSIS